MTLHFNGEIPKRYYQKLTPAFAGPSGSEALEQVGVFTRIVIQLSFYFCIYYFGFPEAKHHKDMYQIVKNFCGVTRDALKKQTMCPLSFPSITIKLPQSVH